MPAQPFSVHLDPDDLARQDIAAAVPLPAVTGAGRSGRPTTIAHHGARDGKLAARQRSERERSSRASGIGSGRSYAFRRS
ncbi:MAG TPA: hypothetical protein VFH03_00745 [Actinoplanes sp.]|nr:hypothetical protein [Actinoplanes sp.]